MALTWIPNQPVIFNEDAETCVLSNQKYRQLIKPGDVTNVQFIVDFCNSSENLSPGLCSSGNFDEVGDGWTFADCKATKSAGNFGRLLDSLAIINTQIYNAVFTVDAISGSFGIYNGGSNIPIGIIDSLGTTSFGFTGDYTGVIVIQPMTIDSTITLSAWSLWSILGDFSIVLYDNDGNFIERFDQSEYPEIFNFYGDKLTVKFDWSGLDIEDYGCYRIAVLNPCENTNGQNGACNGELTASTWGPEDEFFSTRCWENGGTLFDTYFFTTIEGKGHFYSNEYDACAYLSNFGSNLTAGVEYTVTVTVSGILLSTLLIYIGGNVGTEITTNGTFTQTITAGPEVDALGRITFRFYGCDFPAQAGPHELFIDNVIVAIPNNELSPNLWSNPFELGNHECTVVVNGGSNNDALGFGFIGTGFNPTLRLSTKLYPSNEPYASVDLRNTDSKGKQKGYYFGRRKTSVISVREPLFIHDFLSILAGFDHFYLDNIEQNITDDSYPAIKWNRERSIGRCEIEVSEKTQYIVKSNKGAESERSFALPPNYLGRSGVGGRILTGDGNRILITI